VGGMTQSGTCAESIASGPPLGANRTPKGRAGLFRQRLRGLTGDSRGLEPGKHFNR
jgi:hypothetical protein